MSTGLGQVCCMSSCEVTLQQLLLLALPMPPWVDISAEAPAVQGNKDKYTLI